MHRRFPASVAGFSGFGGWIVIVLVLMVPLGFAGLGGWFIFDEARFAAGAVKVEGTVIDRGRTEGESGSTFRPTFRFVTPEGVEREARAHSSDSGFGFAHGAQVTILYNPDRPNQVRPHGLWLQYGFGAIFFLLGMAVFGGFVYGFAHIALYGKLPGA